MASAYVAMGVICSCIVFAFAAPDGVSVTTSVGTFVGLKKDVLVGDKSSQINTFLGIPYAEPPVGDLRFRKPVPKATPDEPLVTQKYGPECIQVKLLPSEYAKSEDCLYLNVYVPVLDEGGSKKAVMVWIHGGAFVTGSANIYVADKFAATGDVIVVTINYRVSALAFLNTGDSASPGNYGLWDQHLAIKWVHDNVEAFGGDTDRITIFGESAGSGSVVYQGLYPGNKGLFQRIIAQSGSAASPWATTRNAKEDANELATLVGCERVSSQEMVECLRSVPVDDIASAINGDKLMRNPFPFVPSVDGEFVKMLPSDIFDTEADIASEEQATFASFDLLTGANFAEGATCISPFCNVKDDPNNFLPTRDTFEKELVPFCVEYTYGKDAPSLLNDLIIAEYTDWADPENPLAIREQFVAMHSDANFIASLHTTVNLHVTKSQKDTYVYHFTAELDKHFLPMPPWVKKAIHGDDLMYVFGSRALFETFGAGTEEFSPLEQDISDNFMTMWTNFAKTGSPNKPRDIGVTWPPYTAARHTYLEITEHLSEESVKERLDEGRANLWNRLLPEAYKALSHSHKSMYDSTCEKPGDCSP